MEQYIRSLAVALFCIVLPCAAGAQTAVPAASPPPALQPQPPLSMAARMQHKWSEVNAALAKGALAEASDRVRELNQLKIEAGYDSMESYSLSLLRKGYEELQAGRRDNAAFFERKVFELSPHAPRIQLKAAWLSRELGSALVATRLMSALRALSGSSQVGLMLVKEAPARVLWALSLGLYVLLLVYLLAHMQGLARGLMAHLPVRSRGVSGPILTALAVAAPLYFGPLCAVAVWALLATFVLQERKIFIRIAGLLLLLWGAFLPLRAQLQYMLADDQAQLLLAELSGDFRPEVAQENRWREIKKVHLTNGVLSLGLGSALLRRGEYEAARLALNKAEMLVGRSGASRALLGLAAIGVGDMPSAQTLFSEAQALGANSIEFLFDYSKIKFTLLDTVESKRLLQRAIAANLERATELEQRERQVTPGSLQGYVLVQPPLYELVAGVYWAMGAAPLSGTPGRRDPLGDVSLLLLGGAALLLLSLAPLKGVRRHRGQVYYARFRLPAWLPGLLRWVPGALWLTRGYVTLAFAAASCTALLLLPLTSGADSILYREGLVHFAGFYWAAVALFVLGVISVGYYFTEDR